ncbi:MAG: FISUMP domain-containing protein [Bacteroidota bacterium]|nr:FISUMP domain-containing protein [Bacteroidota bacterium]
MKKSKLNAILYVSLGIMLTFSLSNCSGYGLEDPPEAPSIDTGSGVIGTLGGIIYIGDLSSDIASSVIVIPEGALQDPVNIKISKAPSNISLPDDASAIVVRFEPEGLQFEKEVYIGLSYAHKSSLNPSDYKIVNYDPQSGTVTDLVTADADQENMILYAATSHFSYFALTSASSGGASFGEFTDSRNSTTYRTIQIGTQIWMADNLNYQSGYGACWKGIESYCDTYGYLYTWEGAMKACPYRWHLPTEQDWQTLELFLGVAQITIENYQSRGISVNAGGRLKDTRLWDNPNEGANNETGFSAIPGSQRYWDGSWDDEGPSRVVHYWTATETTYDSNEVYIRSLYNDDVGITRGSIRKDVAFSVRCIKD